MRLNLGVDQRQLDAQDPVTELSLGLIARHVRAELDHTPERARGDLELLVEAAFGDRSAAMPGDHELATLDLEPDLVTVDAGNFSLDDRARRITLVIDIDGGHETAAALDRRTKDVAEKLVHLAPHALEVCEEITLS
jgi:hypothetical protein